MFVPIPALAMRGGLQQVRYGKEEKELSLRLKTAIQALICAEGFGGIRATGPVR